MNARSLLCLLSALLLSPGVGCRLYLNEPVTFRVRDAETKQPIEGAEIRTSYLTMLDFGVLPAAWGPKEGKTDADGNLTLIFDPNKDCTLIDISVRGYHRERNMGGGAIRERLVSKGLLTWGSDLVIDMYKQPAAELDLVVPNGYHGPVLIRFAPVDTPPERIGQRHFTYELARNGQVAIRESVLFERFEVFDRIHAHFQDGAQIPTVEDPSATSIRADSVALWFITPVSEHHTWVYFLGTKAEAGAVHAALCAPDTDFAEAAFERLMSPR